MTVLVLISAALVGVATVLWVKLRTIKEELKRNEVISRIYDESIEQVLTEWHTLAVKRRLDNENMLRMINLLKEKIIEMENGSSITPEDLEKIIDKIIINSTL